MRLFTVVVAVLLVVVAGCGDPDPGGEAAPTPRTSSSSPAFPPPTPEAPRPRCSDGAWGDLDVEEGTFDTTDGVRLFGVEAGRGPRGVVLLPGTASTGACNWAAVAPLLVADGLHVLAIDHRCQGLSDCPDDDTGGLDVDARSAAAELRRRGARTVVVVGESRGGGVALVAPLDQSASDDPTRIDAVAAVSGVFFDETYTGARAGSLDRLVPALDVPALFLSSRDDDLVEQATYRGWARAAPRGEYAVWKEGGHGAFLLVDFDGSPRPAYRRLTEFLDRVFAR